MKIEDSYMSCHGGEMSAYVGGDDDPDSPDLRLFFTKSGLTCWIDLPPERMAYLRDSITVALLAAGCCKHGKLRDDEFCFKCDALIKAKRIGNEP